MRKGPRVYEVRDPIHGMISFNEMEWDLVNSFPFQRLRRIRQLAWTDYVYPGAMHTRFEHSLGVCHVVSRLFDAIAYKNKDLLQSEYRIEKTGIERQRQILRLAALTHDLGHGPFSHAAEEAFPYHVGTEDHWSHEEYSAEIVRQKLSDIIESHPNNNNFRINCNEITSMFDGKSNFNQNIVWKELISGQMDADRMDYLLRDSYHAGVTYGKYDLDRLINTVVLCEDSDSGGHLIGIDEDGMHAVEGLILARYMMFTQVYFHKTRVAFDLHYDEAIRILLKDSRSVFPSPDTPRGLDNYLAWDDWRVLGSLQQEESSEHIDALRNRNHYRRIFSTPECPNEDDRSRFNRAEFLLDGLGARTKDAKKSWYKFQKEEIRLLESSNGVLRSVPLAERSPVVDGLRTVEQKRIYVSPSTRFEAEKRLKKL